MYQVKLQNNIETVQKNMHCYKCTCFDMFYGELKSDTQQKMQTLFFRNLADHSTQSITCTEFIIIIIFN